MSKYLFHLASYNDVDQITPIIYQFLRKNHIVKILFISRFDYKDDYRIKFLKKYRNLEIANLTKIEKIKKKIFFSERSQKLQTKLNINRFVLFLLNIFWPNKRIVGINSVIYGWSLPYLPNLFEAKYKGIKVVGIPHGQNIFLNIDVNPRYKKIYSETGHYFDYSPRNIFDKYIFQTEWHKDMNIQLGLNKKNSFALGSLRYCPEWSKLNLKLVKEYSTSQLPLPNRNQLKIVFFCPHWDHNVNIKKTFETIEKIIQNKNYLLIVRTHTRETKYSNKINNLLMDKSNANINTKDHSPLLIDWADIVINFASSIGIEAILQNKTIINLPYLHENITIFDDNELFHNANSINELLDLLGEGKKLISINKDKSKLKKFMNKEIYCSDNFVNVLERYYELLK